MLQTVNTFMLKNVAFAISIIFLHSTVSPAQVITGKLKGIVVDWQYARVLGSCLTVKSENLEKKVVVDTNGAFEVELPAGIYQVTAQSPGFQRFHWKELHIEPNAIKTLNIMLKVAPVKAGCPAGTRKAGGLCINVCDL